MDDKIFVAGDTGSKLIVECLDHESGAKISLVDKVARLRFWYRGDNSVTVKTMVHQDAPNQHKAEYLFEPGELKAGDLFYDVEIENLDGTIVTQLEEVILQVRKKKAA